MSTTLSSARISSIATRPTICLARRRFGARRPEDKPEAVRHSANTKIFILRMATVCVVAVLSMVTDIKVVRAIIFCKKSMFFAYRNAVRLWRRCNIALITHTTSAGLSKLGATPAAQVSGGQIPPSANKEKGHCTSAHHVPPSGSPQTTRQLVSPGKGNPSNDDSSELSSQTPQEKEERRRGQLARIGSERWRNSPRRSATRDA